MGLSQDVPPVPNGTMVRDGHLGLNPSGWYNGIILDVPPVPYGTMVWDGHLGLNPTCWYNEIILDVPPVLNGTMVRDGHLGLNPHVVVQWDYPGMSHLYQMVQWYRMDTWD